jgi:hypothetical protein
VLTTDLIAKVKTNLGLADATRDLLISDVIQNALNYCNLTELPVEVEPFIRKKVQSIINYETENGTGSVFDIKSLKEGDTTVTYNVDDSLSRETIYGLSSKDKETLRMFRRTRK